MNAAVKVREHVYRHSTFGQYLHRAPGVLPSWRALRDSEVTRALFATLVQKGGHLQVGMAALHTKAQHDKNS